MRRIPQDKHYNCCKNAKSPVIFTSGTHRPTPHAGLEVHRFELERDRGLEQGVSAGFAKVGVPEDTEQRAEPVGGGRLQRDSEFETSRKRCLKISLQWWPGLLLNICPSILDI